MANLLVRVRLAVPQNTESKFRTLFLQRTRTADGFLALPHRRLSSSAAGPCQGHFVQMRNEFLQGVAPGIPSRVCADAQTGSGGTPTRPVRRCKNEKGTRLRVPS